MNDELYLSFTRFIKDLSSHSSEYGRTAKVTFDPHTAILMTDVLNNSCGLNNFTDTKVDLFSGLQMCGVDIGVSMSLEQIDNLRNTARKYSTEEK